MLNLLEGPSIIMIRAAHATSSKMPSLAAAFVFIKTSRRLTLSYTVNVAN